MTTETMPTYDELLALYHQLLHKVATLEQRIEQVEISESRVDQVSDLLHETPADRDHREATNAEQQAHRAAKQNALHRCAADLRMVHQRRDRLATYIKAHQAWRRRCQDTLRDLDARMPDKTISLAYDTWQQERAPWQEALAEVERGCTPDFESDLVAEWRRDARIQPAFPGDRWPYLGLRMLRRLLADEEAHIERIERQATSYGLNVTDLRKAITV